jgi:hypothetical protein
MDKKNILVIIASAAVSHCCCCYVFGRKYDQVTVFRFKNGIVRVLSCACCLAFEISFEVSAASVKKVS